MADSSGTSEGIFEQYKRDYLFHFSRLLNKVLVEPEMIQIMLTNRCNIKCRICEVWKQTPGEEMSTDVVKHLIDQAVGMGIKTIYMTGGEAFLRKDIFELIDYSARPGITTTVNTNGSFITDELAKKIVSSKLRNITFSLDGATAKTHDAIRGEGVFEKAVRGVEYINHYKKELHRDGFAHEEQCLNVGLTSVIMKINIEELPELVNLAQRLQCCYICFQPLVQNGNLLESSDFKTDFWIEGQDILRLERVFGELGQIKINRSSRIGVDFMPEKTIQHFKRQRTVNSCFAGFTRIFVSTVGDISFVCFPSFGNIHTDLLRQSWLSEKAFGIRRQLKSCAVNCTQFCSERPCSDSIQEIHQRFREGIHPLQVLDQDRLIALECNFLQSMSELVSAADITENEKAKTLGEIKQALFRQ